jgi:hypothetical protein
MRHDRRLTWHCRALTLGLVMALMGCATGDGNLQRLDTRIDHTIGVELPKNSDNWNTTDWTLWTTMQGGG